MEGEIDKENYTLKYNELCETIEKLKAEKFDMESNFKDENINKKRMMNLERCLIVISQLRNLIELHLMLLLKKLF
jgi:hypothetical protein